MKNHFFDQRKLQGRKGTRAMIYVLGLLLSQLVAAGLMVGILGLMGQAATSMGASISCSLVIFSSLTFTFLLFSKKGLKTQKRVASKFEIFVFSIFKPRTFCKSPPFQNLPCDPDDNLGTPEGPYPPPPRISLA